MKRDFYKSWKLHQEQAYNCSEYIVAFLKKEPVSLDILQNGSDAEIEEAITVIEQEPLENFIECLKMLDYFREVRAAEVPQFSAFHDATDRLVQLLLFAPNGLTFDEAGYQLIKAKSMVAQKKYGENHAKLAEMMSLVSISRGGVRFIKKTALGRGMLGINPNIKDNVLAKLLLREYLFQKMIVNGLDVEECVDYRDIVSVLSDSTAHRRSSNVRFLMNFILNKTVYEKVLYKIKW